MAFTRRKNGVSTITRDSYHNNSSGKSWWEIGDQVRKRDNYTCVTCGKFLGKGKGDIDHITPLSKGGLTVMSNLRLLCNGPDGCHAKRHPHLHKKLTLGRR